MFHQHVFVILLWGTLMSPLTYKCSLYSVSGPWTLTCQCDMSVYIVSTLANLINVPLA